MKIMAMYLPQYHEIKENNDWWGKGYTEWIAVRNAHPLFKGHVQPRIPINNNYYDLSDPDAKTWKWQASLAKEYGIYGFCIYHYWLKNGKQLLEKPMEILLNHPEIDINYTICWANETWRRIWYSQKHEILLEQTYGNEDEWERHFQYLLPFFKDRRYIKIDNKPIVNIYKTFDIENFSQMKAYWNKLALENGFSGLFCVSCIGMNGLDRRKNLFDAYYIFEPGFALVRNLSFLRRLMYKLKGFYQHEANKFFRKRYLERTINIDWLYEATLHFLSKHKDDDIIFPGICPMWDNTPRLGHLGFVTLKNSPELFYKQLCLLAQYTPKSPLDFIYVNAWNEWGEGTYLEPDEYYGYDFLNSIKRFVTVVKKCS